MNYTAYRVHKALIAFSIDNSVWDITRQYNGFDLETEYTSDFVEFVANMCTVLGCNSAVATANIG